MKDALSRFSEHTGGSKSAVILKDETILCFSPNKWNDPWRNRQQVMSRLAKHNKVIFIEPQKMIFDAFRSPPTTK